MSPWNQRWRTIVRDSPLLEFIQVMLAGMAQIVWNTDPLCAVILLGALALACPLQLFTCLWALLVSTSLIFLFKLPKDLALDGLYTINPALAGIAVPLVFFQNRTEDLPLLFLLCTAASAIALALTVILRRVTAPHSLSPLGLPYSATLLLLAVCVQLAAVGTVPAAAPSPPTPWTIRSFLTAVCSGLAQVIWVEGVPNCALAGGLVLIGILFVSRIDAFIAVYAALLSTATAVLLGYDAQVISLGLYGYGAVLLSMVLFGRAYKINAGSFLLISVLCVCSVPFTAAVRPLFAALDAPVAAAVWSLLAIGAMCLRRLPGLTYRPPAQWSTPEQSRIL